MADQRLARYVNELAILTTLRTQGPTSRAELSRRLELTPATMSRLVSDMARRGLLREGVLPAARDGAREPGRPGVNVELDPQGAFFLGVEIGVGVLRYALLDLAASVIESSETAIDPKTGPAAVVRRVAASIDKLTRDARFSGKIRSVGVTVPGLVTLDGHVANLPVLGWRDLSLRALLGKALSLPCFIENNATAAAFGSVYTQPSLPSDCTIFLKIGTGCGGAAIVNGRLLRGAVGTAGEFGHLRIAAGGPPCYCGQRGCLETYVNLAAMARAWRADDGADADLAALPAQIARSAKAGDRTAMKAVESLARHLSIGLVALTNVFNPSTVVLGGAMRPLIEPIVPRLKSSVAAGIVPGMVAPDIRMSALGLYECAIGAASIAHHHSFDISNFDLSQRELSI